MKEYILSTAFETCNKRVIKTVLVRHSTDFPTQTIEKFPKITSILVNKTNSSLQKFKIALSRVKNDFNKILQEVDVPLYVSINKKGNLYSSGFVLAL